MSFASVQSFVQIKKTLNLKPDVLSDECHFLDVLALTALDLIFPLNCKIEIPSGFEPILACGSENAAEGSANTRSKSGNIVTPSPDVSPFRPHTRSFGNAAREIKKFLQVKEKNFISLRLRGSEKNSLESGDQVTRGLTSLIDCRLYQ